jgi:hypothetical protein
MQGKNASVLQHNVDYLVKKFPNVVQYLGSYQEENKIVIAAEEARNGSLTLKAKEQFIHSRYDPMNEALRLVESIESNIGDSRHVLFFGVGYGYHIDLFAARNPEIAFTIYEPIVEVFTTALQCENLQVIRHKNLQNVFLGEKYDAYAQHLFDSVNLTPYFFILPSYNKIFKEETERFHQAISRVVNNKVFQVQTVHGFEKLWSINSQLNMSSILNTPSIFEKKTHFENKPVIIVAAGPSLKEELENLRIIKEQGLAYIFAVGSANKALLAEGIYPDAVFSYDPNRHNHNVFSEIIDLGIEEIPLVFGSTVGYETVIRYPGPKLHFLTNQDFITPYFIERDIYEKETVADAPSIAIVTLEIAFKLHFSMVALVGQNFAYKYDRYYSEGVNYETIPETELETVYVESVDGHQIPTIEAHNFSRRQMEHTLANYPDRKVYNTTQGGAKIAGTTFLPLTDIIREMLTDRVVDQGWYEGLHRPYNKEAFLFKAKQIQKSHNALDDLIISFAKEIDRLEGGIHRGNGHLVAQIIGKISNMNKELYKNKYYELFIKPMTRSAHLVFQEKLKEINKKSDLMERAKLIISALLTYLSACQESMRFNEPFFQNLLTHTKAER